MSPVLLATLLLAGAPRDYKKGPGPHEVEVKSFDWKDGKRDREVPAKLYLPGGVKSPSPVIVFSHGLGGTRNGYEYLGRHWASHGYVAVHLQHKGSDDAVWKGKRNPLAALRQAVRDPANALNRPLDVRFALDRLTKLNKEGALKGKLDLARVGMAGHSFGAWTTQVVVGQVQVLPLGKELSYADRRVKAGLILSPSAPPKGDLDKVFGAVKVPCLHMTGTRDDGMGITEVKAPDRRKPFDHMKRAERYLVIFKDGDHMAFAGIKRLPGGGKKDPFIQGVVRMASTAFWDAHLKGDAKARAWLAGGLAKALGKEDTLETASPRKARSAG
jgi:predicted dienelactone hydrolase